MALKIAISVILGGVIGGAVGYLLRCTGGSCPLTCNPWGGAIVGILLSLSFVLH